MASAATATANSAVKGTVIRYISKPRADGWAIVSIRTPSGQAKICGKGLGGFEPGQIIEASGKWRSHARFGDQFEVVDVREIVPESGAGLARWINDIGIPGIGEATSRRLVETFGSETVARIAAGDDRVRMLLGKRFDEAQKAMVANRAEAAFGPVLAAHDIGPSLRRKIFEKYGLATVAEIEKDPYRLITDVDGIAFATADRIAQATGVDLMSRSRLVAAAIDSLRTAANDGHTALDVSALASAIHSRTGVSGGLVDRTLEDLGSHAAIATVVVDEDGYERDAWALRHLDRAEQEIAERILDKVEAPAPMSRERAELYVARVEQTIAPKRLNDEQREAAVNALSSRISVMTGGPGTGKTFTLDVVCKAWALAAREGLVGGRILNAAPTGKASQRMKASTGIASGTIHRLLGTRKGGFLHDESNPVEADFVAIDESSMTDVPLAASLLRGLGEAALILIGDADQLASVGPGRVLGDLIESGVVPTTRLVQIRRQEEGSAVAAGAQAIREGRMPVMAPDSDLVFIECEDNVRIAEMVARLHASYVSEGQDVQVLTPGHQSEVGTIALNGALQAQSGNAGAEIAIGGGARARAGDKVIQIENDADIDIYNGDSGIVDQVGQGGARIRFAERSLDMEQDALRRLELAYALTVHKSQGSEYDVVIMPMTASHWMLLRRTLLYTGLTRARKTCIILGTKRALRQAISNDDVRARVTTLARRLRELKGDGQ